MKKIFEFRCVDCNEQFEDLIEFEEIERVEREDRCDICGGKLKRKMTFGLGQFKGRGFTRRSTN